MTRSTTHIFVTLALAAALSAGCGADGTGETCQPGTVCSFDELPGWQQAVPGRSVRVASTGETFWVATRDPGSGSILVGPAGDALDGELKMRILASTASEGLAMDGSRTRQRVAVAWTDRQGQLFVAVGDGDGWRRTAPLRIRGSADPIAATSDLDIAIGNGETLHVVVRDRARDALIGLTGIAADESWSLRTIDDGAPGTIAGDCRDARSELEGQIGYNPSLLRTSSALSVSYYDALCGNLRLAQRPAGSQGPWTRRLVDDGDLSLGDGFGALPGDVGRDSSMAQAADGTTGIAYQDSARGRLMYARIESDDISRSVVDPGVRVDDEGQTDKRLVGAFPSLVFDGESRPRITYFDGTRARLKLANRRRTGPGVPPRTVWIPETLSAQPPVGFSADLARASDGSELLVAERLGSAENGTRSILVVQDEGGF